MKITTRILCDNADDNRSKCITLAGERAFKKKDYSKTADQHQELRQSFDRILNITDDKEYEMEIEDFAHKIKDIKLLTIALECIQRSRHLIDYKKGPLIESTIELLCEHHRFAQARRIARTVAYDVMRRHYLNKIDAKDPSKQR